MGGYGSGRRGGRDTTSDYLRLDVRKLQRGGFLRFGSWSSQQWSRGGQPIGSINMRGEQESVVLSYRHRRPGAEWVSEEYRVLIEWTPCHYGGSRAWFRCPAFGCYRRVAVLYGSGLFACRHCHQLAYDSQRETFYDRAMTKAQNIRVKLGGSPGFSDPFPAKPKGMHWRSYQRLAEQAEQAENRSWPPWVYRMLGDGRN
jgi:hypothetical protein